MVPEERIPITADADVTIARARAKLLAETLHFSRNDQTLICAAVSEVARNIVVYAGTGEILLRPHRSDGLWGLMIVARDEGPGIADPEQALTDGYSSVGSLGVGLTGARRLMDSLEIDSAPGRGTTVTMLKWGDQLR